MGKLLLASFVISLGLVVAGIAMDLTWLAAVGGVVTVVSGVAWVVRGPRLPTFRNMDDHSTVDPADVERARDG